MAVIYEACKQYVARAGDESEGYPFPSHDPEDVIPVLIRLFRTCYQVARKLSTPDRQYHPATIRYWLKSHGWKQHKENGVTVWKESHEQSNGRRT